MPAGNITAARIARRRLLRAAVFGNPAGPRGPRQPPPAPDGGPDGRPDPGPRAVTGQVLDASPQVLVIAVGEAEERFALTADARAWRGAKTDPAALRIGDQVVVRRHGFRREIADRIWANIGRVTGTIVRRDASTLLVDGAEAGQQVVLISQQTAGRIQVRFPRLEPGYLIDIIGLRHADHLEGLVPATSQPTYRAEHVPAPPLVNRRLPGSISGAAVWHDPLTEPAGLAGVAYPAVDPAAGVLVDSAAGPATGPGSSAPGPGGSGCVSLPYLSVGSLLRVRNDCTGLSRMLPVTGPASTSRLFCDRSVACGPSPRGRIADLTPASFVELGGELDEGSFNVTIEIGA